MDESSYRSQRAVMPSRTLRRLTGVAAVLALAVALAPSPSPASSTPDVKVYTVEAGDGWLSVVRKNCGVAATSQAARNFSIFAFGTANATLRTGQGILIDPALCPAPTTTTTTTVPPTTTTTTVPPTTSTTLPPTPVDLAAWITAGHPIPASTASEPSGNFRFTCGFSHLNYDDPIVYPGQPGASHLHMFFGNTLTNANSTYQSLRTTGDGTCDGGPVNRSGYWTPALIDTAGMVRIPSFIAVYYKSFDQITATQPMPEGLRMIAGFDMAMTGAQDDHWWYCDDSPLPAELNTGTLKSCSGLLLGRVKFPACWDGVNLDSANHRSHMAYPVAGICPTSHPVRLPEVTVTLAWENAADAASWRLSSDNTQGMASMPGQSFHADWFGGWELSVLQSWVSNCIVGMRDCKGGELGDGRQLVGRGFDGNRTGWYTGPLALPQPAKG